MTDDGVTSDPPAPAPQASPPGPGALLPRKPSATALVLGITLVVVGLCVFAIGRQMNLDAMSGLGGPDGGVAVFLGALTLLAGLLVTLTEVARLAKQLDVVYNRAIGAPPGGE